MNLISLLYDLVIIMTKQKTAMMQHHHFFILNICWSEQKGVWNFTFVRSEEENEYKRVR